MKLYNKDYPSKYSRSDIAYSARKEPEMKLGNARLTCDLHLHLATPSVAFSALTNYMEVCITYALCS